MGILDGIGRFLAGGSSSSGWAPQPDRPEVGRVEMRFPLKGGGEMTDAWITVVDDTVGSRISVTIENTAICGQPLTLSPGHTRAKGWPQGEVSILPGKERTLILGREMFSIIASQGGQQGYFAFTPS